MRLSFAICLILAMFSDVSAFEGPECDREKIENYWSNAVPIIFESIEAHLAESLEVGSEYEGYPDLACFTELYLSLEISSDRELNRRVERLLGLEGENLYKDLVLAANRSSDFFYQTYFENVLCVVQQLAGMDADPNHCSDNISYKIMSN